jgi:F-type H+-transporting ATPase subunit b
MELVTPNPGTLFWMFVVFGVVLLILKNFAWKPILNALKEREFSISNALLAAEHARKEVAGLKADHEELRLQGQKEKELIIKEAREIKERIIAEARENAAGEAQKIIEQARQAIQLEKTTAISEIKKQMVDLSVTIAEKIIQENLENLEQQEKIIDGMLKEFALN